MIAALSKYEDYYKDAHHIQVPPIEGSGWAKQGDWVKKTIRGGWMYMGTGCFVFEREQDLTWFRLMWA